MTSKFDQTREKIEFKIMLSVLLGDLNQEVADVWIEAVRSLSDDQIEFLIRKTRPLKPQQACKTTLRYLMEHHYPFRELVLYQTDDTFKRRMGLED